MFYRISGTCHRKIVIDTLALPRLALQELCVSFPYVFRLVLVHDPSVLYVPHKFFPDVYQGFLLFQYLWPDLEALIGRVY